MENPASTFAGGIAALRHWGSSAIRAHAVSSPRRVLPMREEMP